MLDRVAIFKRIGTVDLQDTMYASPLTALVDGSQFFDGLVCVISGGWKHLDTIRAYLDTAQSTPLRVLRMCNGLII